MKIKKINLQIKKFINNKSSKITFEAANMILITKIKKNVINYKLKLLKKN